MQSASSKIAKPKQAKMQEAEMAVVIPFKVAPQPPQVDIVALATKLFGPPDPEQPSDDNIRHFRDGTVSVNTATEEYTTIVEDDGKRTLLIDLKLEGLTKLIKRNGGGDAFAALEKSIREENAAIEAEEAEREAEEARKEGWFCLKRGMLTDEQIARLCQITLKRIE